MFGQMRKYFGVGSAFNSLILLLLKILLHASSRLFVGRHVLL